MSTEYWLQKKTIGGWSNVTWYSDKVQAELNYTKLLSNKGYSYRLVEVQTIQEDLLDEVIEVEAPVYPEYVTKTGWDVPTKPVSNGWGSSTSVQSSNTPVNFGETKEHGLTGSVWVIHHGNKDKKRIAQHLVSEYEANGYVRGGPKTKFRE